MHDETAIGADGQLRTIFARNRAGERQGVYSVCSAHPLVIEAALELARDRGQVAVIEATCNQVNQDGGYTGLTPSAFADQVRATGRGIGLAEDRLVLGGDHLGPQPWRSLPADAAMAKAEALVESYARAGFTKLHLDCSMACGGDAESLGDALVAGRAARLAQVAEAATANRDARPVYIIGTEVPAPGGMGEGHAITPTSPDGVRETWAAHEQAFERAGLADALARVVAIVVQPGLDFGNEDVVAFEPAGADELARSMLALDGAVYEAHSTDYQDPAAYPALVDRHFAILKVGPAATFALREAIYALELVARELPGWKDRWSVRAAIEAAMLRNPANWAGHYHGDDVEQAYLRHFSYSDRLRYYWTDQEVMSAVAGLFGLLDVRSIPLPLVSQYLPQHAVAVSRGTVPATAKALCKAQVAVALAPYADACGVHAAGGGRA